MTYHKQKTTGNKGKKFSRNNSTNKSEYKSNSNNENRFSEDKRNSDSSNNNNSYTQTDSDKSNNHRFHKDNGKNFNNKPDEFKKIKPTVEENRQFAIKGNYKPSSKRTTDSENYLNSNGKNKLDIQKSQKSTQRLNKKSDESLRVSKGDELLLRYDNFFGNGTGRKLQDSIKLYSENQFVRINLSKMSLEEALTFFKKNRVKYETTFLKNGFKIEKSFFNLSSSIPCLSGKIYFQDLASQVPVNCVDFDKLKSLNRVVRVLDGCASPGSKTTQMLDLLNFYGIEYELIAIELEESRVKRLINNIQKMGFSGFKVINTSAIEFKTTDKFDVIVLDVPCSGNLVGDKSWLNKRNVVDICEKSNLQKEIVKNISKYLTDSGELIYSTCSIEPEENEDNVKWIEENCGLKNVNVNLDVGFDARCLKDVLGLRFLPHKSRTQGFFVSKFIRK